VRMSEGCGVYHIRKGRGLMFPYTVYHGCEWPYCKVVAVTMTLRGAHRAIERDKRKLAKPDPLPDPLVWVEGQ
jgi:hypothetical protein